MAYRNRPQSPSRKKILPMVKKQQKPSVSQKFSKLKKQLQAPPAAAPAPTPPPHIQNVYFQEKDVSFTPRQSYVSLTTAYPMTLELLPTTFEPTTFEPTTFEPTTYGPV